MLTDRDKLARVIFDQVVVNDCYGIRHYTDNPPQVIVDIGANCGIFSMFARMLYPHSRIISVEPCPETFGMLEKNLFFYRCQLHNVALSRSEFVAINRGRDSGSNSTVDAEDYRSDGTKIPGMTLAEMFRRWSIYPDHERVMLKVDCEGAERTIIEDPQSEKLIFPCQHVAFEMHYGDGRGAAKWVNAISRSTGEAWVKYVRTTWRARSFYEEHHMGSVRGGIMVLMDWSSPGGGET